MTSTVLMYSTHFNYIQTMHYIYVAWVCVFVGIRLCRVDSQLSVKVADFGFSRDVYNKEYYRLERRTRLPVKWLPPESLLDNIFNEKTDVVRLSW